MKQMREQLRRQSIINDKLRSINNTFFGKVNEVKKFKQLTLEQSSFFTAFTANDESEYN